MRATELARQIQWKWLSPQRPGTSRMPAEGRLATRIILRKLRVVKQPSKGLWNRQKRERRAAGLARTDRI